MIDFLNYKSRLVNVHQLYIYSSLHPSVPYSPCLFEGFQGEGLNRAHRCGEAAGFRCTSTRTTIPFCAKSIGKRHVKSDFQFIQEDSETISNF